MSLFGALFFAAKCPDQSLFSVVTFCQVNELDVAEGVKIRYKVVFALTEVNKDLYDPRSFNDVPLELMPYLIVSFSLTGHCV